MKKLEHAIGKPLFKKQGRRSVLTDAGRDIFSYCRRSFEIFEEMTDHLKKKKNSMGVRLTIGVTNDIGRPFITDLVSHLQQQDKVEFKPLINLVSLDAEKLIEMLRMSEIDILITSKAPVDGQIHIHEVLSLPVVALANKRFAASVKNKTLEQIIKDENTGFALPSRLSPLRQSVDLFFQKKRVTPKVTFQSNIISSVIRAASQGLGITFLPKVYVQKELTSRALFCLSPSPLWSYKVMILTNRSSLGSEKKKHIKSMKALLTQTAKSFHGI